jgi:hypothetical protein
MEVVGRCARRITLWCVGRCLAMLIFDVEATCQLICLNCPFY